MKVQIQMLKNTRIKNWIHRFCSTLILVSEIALVNAIQLSFFGKIMINKFQERRKFILLYIQYECQRWEEWYSRTLPRVKYQGYSCLKTESDNQNLATLSYFV